MRKVMRSKMPALIFFLVSTALAEDFHSQEAIYVRCHLQLLGMRPAPNDLLRLTVAEGVITGAEGCMKLLSYGDLEAGGMIKNLNDSTANADMKKKAAEVFRVLNDLHRSWFQSENYAKVLPVGECYLPTASAHDPVTPALYYTRSVFVAGAKASDVVKLPQGLSAIRQRPNPLSPVPELQPQPYGEYGAQRFAAGQTFPDNTAPIWNENAVIVPKGRLVGITNSPVAAIPALPTTPQVPPQFAYPSFDVKKTYGGGLLGTPAFLLLNLGRNISQSSDGGKIMARRWSVAILRDVLCRDLPAIRSSDVIDKIDGLQFPNAAAFRTSNTCMQCHATMDNMAGSARNLMMISASLPSNCPTGVFNSMHMRGLNVTGGSGTPILLNNPTTAYATTPPVGRLYYRSYSGDLIDQQFTGLQGLGDALATKEDLYVCAAKRYYSFFTGITVNLQDPGNATSDDLSEKDLAHRNLVIGWGKELLQTQDMKLLIRRVFESEAYQKRFFGAGQ